MDHPTLGRAKGQGSCRCRRIIQVPHYGGRLKEMARRDHAVITKVSSPEYQGLITLAKHKRENDGGENDRNHKQRITK